MKLNKNGWGTTEMLLLSGGIILALIIAIYFISQLFGDFENSFSNKNYADLEVSLQDAAKKYVRDNDIIVENSYRISLYDLKQNGYINSFKDNNDEDCNGYVVVNNYGNINYEYKAYILCNDYMTNNY